MALQYRNFDFFCKMQETHGPRAISDSLDFMSNDLSQGRSLPGLGTVIWIME